MAYNFYPQPQFYQQPQMQSQQMMQQVPPQMQSGGFMSIRSEQDARNYPVAPGSVVTFKIENQPYVCEKAQGFSQLEGPIFNKYKLVKEDSNLTHTGALEDEANNYITKDDIKAVWHEIEALKHALADLKEGV